ncbi:MAG: flagellar biosynthetic protein FliQ [Candidatus Latescibacterota bacterium]|nr:flagellar biosynthesis protein FliQ [Candidatus Latescibacterota bacterium]OPX25841.1 MAG: flagellar biosynthetic protein FliQ [Candidatus Latescibacteria bacterium 4484_107]RKY69978.1 MAG: flagellar biosynthetic protein FliQ [Candidatus Latescibacterota bacterium]
MTPQSIIHLARETILLVLLVSAPMLGFALLVGLGVSILQAVTQIHEMTLVFIPKILAAAIGMILFLPWMLRLIMDFTARILTSLAQAGG